MSVSLRASYVACTIVLKVVKVEIEEEVENNDSQLFSLFRKLQSLRARRDLEQAYRLLVVVFNVRLVSVRAYARGL